MGVQEAPYDCGITPLAQLEQARKSGLDAIFVTNHNTLDGYTQLKECRDDHRKFHTIKVYPAEEITLDTGAHILAYGINTCIQPGMSIGETLDAIKRQGAISSAPHPFSLLDALREDAAQCDIIEIFNSNNVDIISNMRAAEFAQSHGMTGVAGSDSHVLSTVGRCVNSINAENNIDDIIQSMKHGNLNILHSGYARSAETLEHLQYKIRNSQEYLEEYIRVHYPKYGWLLRLLFGAYNSRPNSILWSLVYKLGVYMMSRVSAKINLQGVNPDFMKQRDLASMLRASIL